MKVLNVFLYVISYFWKQLHEFKKKTYIKRKPTNKQKNKKNKKTKTKNKTKPKQIVKQNKNKNKTIKRYYYSDRF